MENVARSDSRSMTRFPRILRSGAPLRSSVRLGLLLSSALVGFACSEADDDSNWNDGEGGTSSELPTGPGTGGFPSASSGGATSTGGESSAGGSTHTGGTNPGSGGDESGSGGESNPGAGGASSGSGGASSGSGGAPSGSGGASSGSGGASATCQKPTPPTTMQQTIDLTWQEMTGGFEGKNAARPRSASILSFGNSILDQLHETGGTLNYCVRYDSTTKLSATDRDKIEASLEYGINEWIRLGEDHDCFPYDHVPVKIVGWAAMNRDTFDWRDGDHPGRFYIGDNSFENAPQCAQTCGRFFNRQAGYSYPNCPGGKANHYDMSLWLSESFGGGVGGDWGQRQSRASFINAASATSASHIFVHEVGHGFGFPDYYDQNWFSWVDRTIAKPHTLMNAGAAQRVTDWDGWMFRHLWTQMKAHKKW